MDKQELKQAKDWATDCHNKEDFGMRSKMSLSCLSTQINQIRIEENRLTRNYKRALKEAQDHRLNCERDLIKEYRNRDKQFNV